MQRDAAYVPFVESASYPLRTGCAVRPLVDGEPAFRRICQAVEAARTSVWVTVAFLKRELQLPDGRGSFFDVLERAHARGVDVRALFWRCPELEAVEPGTHFSGMESERAWLLARDARFLARWDRATKLYCQHQKSWLIDAGEATEVAFVGGINLSQNSVSMPGHAELGTHDVYVELQGPCATDVHHNFVQRWNEASDRLEPHGLWPDVPSQNDMTFPSRLSPAAGELPVQIQRTVHAGMYRDGTPAPLAAPFDIAAGEFSILAQYLQAIACARSTIYIEDQAIGSLECIEALIAALRRGVEVVYLVPGQAPTAMLIAMQKPESAPFARALAALGDHPNFALVGIAANGGPGDYRDIYVHAKIALVDDAFCTIGSCNVATRSFYGDTELNASFWHGQTVRALRCELIREHTDVDTVALDDRAALQHYARVARANTARRERGEPQQGLAFAIDPAKYAR
jgi:phosphatidylserine/phosphatidylglycerophosphate/cardiolipin synthase-like enzyme